MPFLYYVCNNGLLCYRKALKQVGTITDHQSKGKVLFIVHCLTSKKKMHFVTLTAQKRVTKFHEFFPKF